MAAFKYAGIFQIEYYNLLALTGKQFLYMQEKLGLILEKEDEMECLVGGCNFLLKAIRHEAFMYENGALNFVTNTGASACCVLQS